MDFDFLANYDIDEDEDQKLEKTKDFSRWSELPPELKCIVISYLDLKSKIRLSSCSKQDNDLVDFLSFEISLFAAREVKDKVCVDLTFGRKEKATFSKRISFAKLENDTVISWKRRMDRKETRKILKVRDSDYYEESLKFIEKWMKFDVDIIYVNMNRQPLESIPSKRSLGRCKQLFIHSRNGMLMKWWFVRLDPKLKYISLTSHESDNSSSYQFLSMDHFKMTNSLSLFHFTNCTDEQFLGLSAKRALIQTKMVTDRAVNQFIHNWLNGEVREDFEKCTIWFEREIVKAEILENFIVSKRELKDGYSKQTFNFLKHDESGKRLKLDLYRTWLCIDASEN